MKRLNMCCIRNMTRIPLRLGANIDHSIESTIHGALLKFEWKYDLLGQSNRCEQEVGVQYTEFVFIEKIRHFDHH